MKFIKTNHAPAAIGPYSQAVLANQTLFISGQLPIDMKTSALIDGDIKAQTTQCLNHIKAILEHHEMHIEDIVKCTVYLKDMKHFPMMNEAYETFFKTHKPARVAVEVSRLPKDAEIEIDAIAVVPSSL